VFVDLRSGLLIRMVLLITSSCVALTVEKAVHDEDPQTDLLGLNMWLGSSFVTHRESTSHTGSRSSSTELHIQSRFSEMAS